MQPGKSLDFDEVQLDAEETAVIPIASSLPQTEPPPGGATPPSQGAGQRDTPLLPPPLPIVESLRATLTILTGLDAGRLITVEGAPIVIGRADDSDLVVDEMGVSRHHARVGRRPDGGFYVEDLGSTNGTFLGDVRITTALLDRGCLLQLGPRLQMRFAVLDGVDEALHQQLYDSSVRDPLTQIFNRRYLEARLLSEVARARRAKAELALLMIDVDSLKAVNDTFGHLAGDRALRAVAARIYRALRVEDVLVRFGGDEFVVLAVGTDRVDARQLAERVRRAVEGLRMSARGRDVRITASIGVASLGELGANDDPAALLATADGRMYRAKETGKNRVCQTDVVTKIPRAGVNRA
ncbi:MAG TPA: GGDEF domain-containing protein [Polyangiaceae bacterium]|nr:GGDEF domain-containing protein [Polyangiaceae bacterium]